MTFVLPASVLYLLIGIMLGITFTIIFLMIKNKHSNKFCGSIEVDIQSNLCKFHVTSTELSNSKTKIALFKVEHRS